MIYGFYTLLFLVSFLSFLFLSDNFVEKQQQIVFHQNEIEVYQKQIESLKEDNRLTKLNVENLKTLAGQEMIARKQLGMIYADEMIVEWEIKND